MTDFWIKQNDLRPNLSATLEDDSGNAIDLSSASSVDFHMQKFETGNVTVDSSATITDAANGKVEYEWSSGDTDKVGTYQAEFEVDWGNDKESFPNDGHLFIEITAEIA